MVAIIIFYIHLVAFVAVFAKRLQDESLSEGLLGVAFMALIFVVGWSIWSFLLKIIISPEGFSKAFNRDMLTLIFLTISEVVLYAVVFRKDTSHPATNAPLSANKDEKK